jgi:hypothetical protein
VGSRDCGACRCRQARRPSADPGTSAYVPIEGGPLGDNVRVTSQSDERPIPPSTSLADAARQAVEGFLASTAFHPSTGEVDSIEVVGVAEAAEPHVRMTWHQGEHLFGLLIPISRLAVESGGLDAVPFYLRLAMDEPHSPTEDGSRHWFSDLPSGPY